MSLERKFRRGQKRLFQFSELHRVCGFVARRQYGKTTVVAGIALKKMMKTRGHTVVFGSAKLSLSREIVRKEAEIIHQAFRSLPTGADARRVRFVDDSPDGAKPIPSNISADDFAEIFEAQRLETRYYHSNNATDYSRTKVVALTPDAVGETGDLITDEIRAIRNWREVAEAIGPIISSNPEYRWILTTTPPVDDTHYGYEQLAPPIGSIFEPNPEGNTYISETGIHILRLDAWDAYADGVPLYDDDTGKPLTPEEHRAIANDKQAWDRNYGCKFLQGGSAACDMQRLRTAQERGMGGTGTAGVCRLFQIENDLDMVTACAWLAANLDPKLKVGLGLDKATTTKATSNPTVLSVSEDHNPELVVRANFVWKTKDPDIANERIEQVLDVIQKRAGGGRAKALAIDATNERYDAEAQRKRFRKRVPVLLVVGSEGITTEQKPGLDKPTNWKEYLGDQYVAKLDDNHLTLPPERYVYQDHRLVMKDRGKFVCEPNEQGMHGDTFDGNKLSLHALVHRGGDAKAIPATTGQPTGSTQ